MKTIYLASDIATGLATLIDNRALIQANSGGGKSWCLRRLLEQSHGAVQQLVIDPEGEFPSLRERFDYVLAAKHGGDTAAEPRAAGLLAERLLELGASAILDLYELKAHERVRFVRLFLEALVDAPKKLWHPVLVVLDEAHVFCPQQGEAESAGAVIDLCTRGRKRGFGPVLATQRLSKLHKDAAAELNNKLIGRTGLDVDVKRAADELGFGKERWRELRELEPGEFFVFGPAMTREVRKATIGPIQTTHPKAGARLAFTAPPPTDRIKALLPKLSDLPAEQERKAKTEADLQHEIRSLKAQLSAAERRVPAPPAPKVKEVRVLNPKLVLRLEAAVKRHAEAQLKACDAGDVVREAVVELQRTLKGALEMPVPARMLHTLHPLPVGTLSSTIAQPRASQPRPAGGLPGRSGADGEGLSGPEQRILDALAWFESIGIGEPQQAAAAFLAGYTSGGGAWNNPKGRLRTAGHIVYLPGDRLALTQTGRALAQAPSTPLSPAELQIHVMARLPGPERKLLRALLEAYPKPLSNEDLATRAGYEPNGGAFNNPKGRLRSLGLIDYPAPGQAVALPLLFLEEGR